MSPSRLDEITIVVVEDHDDARRYLDLYLGQFGAKVVAASNAFEGLEAIKNTSQIWCYPTLKCRVWGSNC